MDIPYINSDMMRYMFAFSTMLLLFVLIRPHADVLAIGKQETNLEELLKENPFSNQNNIEIYSANLIFNNGLMVTQKPKKNLLFVDNKVVAELSKEELKFWIMHEYSHIKDNDLLKMQIISILAYTLVPLVLITITSLINFPENLFISLSIVGFFGIVYIVGVLYHFKYKRTKELKCDTYASAFANRENIKTSFEKFVRMNLISEYDLDLFSGHPSLKRRLENLKIN